MKLRSILGVIAAFVVGAFVFIFTDLTQSALPWHPVWSRWWLPPFTVACVVLPLAAAFVTLWFVTGRRPDPVLCLRWLPRSSQLTLLGLYLFTWAFGVPAVISASQARAVRAYKVNLEQGRDVGKPHPNIRTAVGFPLLPGVIVIHHEYQVGYLHGWAGWEVHLWYWGGSLLLLRHTHWIS